MKPTEDQITASLKILGIPDTPTAREIIRKGFDKSPDDERTLVMKVPQDLVNKATETGDTDQESAFEHIRQVTSELPENVRRVLKKIKVQSINFVSDATAPGCHPFTIRDPDEKEKDGQ